MKDIENVATQCPGQIKNLVKACEEMLKDAGPTKDADYFEEKKLIQDALDKSKQNQALLDAAIPKFKQTQAKLNATQDQLKDASAETLKALIADLQLLKGDLDQVSVSVFGVQNDVLDISEALGDFWIPMNISHRADEIENLNEKIRGLQAEFKELKKADEDFEGSKEMEKQIGALVQDIQADLDRLESESKGHTKFQEGTLMKYSAE